MIYSSRFSYKCGKQFPVSRNLNILVLLHTYNVSYCFTCVDVLELLDREEANKAMDSFHLALHNRDFILKGKCTYIPVCTCTMFNLLRRKFFVAL